MSDGTVRIDNQTFDLTKAEICLLIDGVPTYTLRYGSHEKPLARTPVTVTLGGEIFSATVARATQYGGDIEIHAVGGNGSLSSDLAVAVDGKGYISFPAHLPLEDLLSEIDVVATPETLTTAEAFAAPRWQRLGGSAAHAVSTLARAAGLSWRVLGDGRLRMAAETWPAYDTAALEIEDDCASLSLLRASHLFDRADLAPGMTVDGRQVTRVVYQLTPEKLRMTIQYAAPGAQTFRDALAGAVARSAAPLGYGGVYEARVAKQNANRTVDVITGLTSVDGPDGLVAVPLRLGLARARQVLPEGYLVRLRFEASSTFPGGDPSKPYVESIEQDTSADRGIHRIGDLSRCKFTITTTTILLKGFIITPWRDVAGVMVPRPDLMVTVEPGTDAIFDIELEAVATTASEEIFLK